MKKIGLIGGTGPESTIVYYRRLVYDVQKRAGSACFPNLTIESLSVFDVLNFCEQGNFSGLTQYLLSLIHIEMCIRDRLRIRLQRLLQIPFGAFH